MIAKQVPGLNVGAVGHLAGLLRIVLVLVHNEREAGCRPRHPDLAEGAELAESLLEVPFRGLNKRLQVTESGINKVRT